MNYMYFLQCVFVVLNLCCLFAVVIQILVFGFGVLILDYWVGLYIWVVDVMPNNKQHNNHRKGTVYLSVFVYVCVY